MQSISTRTLIRITLVFLILVFGVSLQYLIPYVRSKKTSDFSKTLGSITAEKVDTITIRKDTTDIHIEKKNSRWFVNGKPADQSVVQDLVTAIVEHPSIDTIAKTKETHESFHVTDTTGTILTLNKGPSLYIGSDTSDGKYIRFKDNDTVYLIHGMSRLPLDDPQQWYDKSIVSPKEDAIKNIHIVSQKGEITLSHTGSVWKTSTDTKDVDTSSIRPILSGLSPLHASSVIEKEIPTYSGPSARIDIETQSGKESLQLTKGTDQWLVIRASDNTAFLVPDLSITPLLIDPSSIIFLSTPSRTPTSH